MKYDIKIYRVKLPTGWPTGNPEVEEMETIRGLTETQKITIVAVLERHGIRHLVKRVENE